MVYTMPKAHSFRVWKYKFLLLHYARIFTFFYPSEAFCDPIMYQKCVCGRGSAPDLAGGANNAPPDPPSRLGRGIPPPQTLPCSAPSRAAREKRRSPPFPFPPLPSPPFPSSPPFPFPLLRSRPQIQLEGLGERCKLPQQGLGRSPSRNRIWCILALKSVI